MDKKEKKKKLGLTTKIFISLIAGAIFGVVLSGSVWPYQR